MSPRSPRRTCRHAGARRERGTPLWGSLAIALLLTSADSREVRAQLTADLLLLPQYGRRLYVPLDDPFRTYGRLDPAYRYRGFAVGGRFEFEHARVPDASTNPVDSYGELTQRWAEFQGARLRVRAGQFHTILGHALLHRSYELPGVVYEELGTRTRYAASRDMDGALLEWRQAWVSARAFHGRFNDATRSPASEESGAGRDGSLLTGGQGELRLPWNSRLGAAGLREEHDDGVRRTFASFSAGSDLLARAASAGWSLPVAVEAAREGGHPSDWAPISSDGSVAHALYGSAGLMWRQWSLSGEWKDYSRMRLGYNDPPPLVREQSWPLLNRNTHLLDAQSEQGHQFELNAPLLPWMKWILNWSRSDGAPNARVFRFEERFAEVWMGPSDGRWEVRGYADRGYDTQDFISDRHAAGVSIAARWRSGWAGELEAERQRVVRAGVLATTPYEDILATASVSRSGWGSAGISVTRTTDPLDLPFDLFGEPTAESAVFAGVTVAADLGTQHRAELFVGERRGGRACVSGTCYDVPSLDGAELRWTSRFP